MFTDTSICAPGDTDCDMGTDVIVPICSPLINAREYDVVQVVVPAFCSFQVLVKAAPGAMTEPSGMVTSATKAALSPVETGAPWVAVACKVEDGVNPAAWVNTAMAV